MNIGKKDPSAKRNGVELKPCRLRSSLHISQVGETRETFWPPERLLQPFQADRLELPALASSDAAIIHMLAERFREVLDTWQRHWRAVGPDRCHTAGLLRQRQPNGQVEAGSIKDFPSTEFGQARLRHRAAQGQRVGGEPYCLETGCLPALPGGGGDHADQLVPRLEHQRHVAEIESPRGLKTRG